MEDRENIIQLWIYQKFYPIKRYRVELSNFVFLNFILNRERLKKKSLDLDGRGDFFFFLI